MGESQHKILPDKKIGFVVDPDAGPDDRIAYILTTHNELEGHWDIWPARCENDEDKKRSVRGYAQALFILFSYAIPKASGEYNPAAGRLPAICLYRTDDIYGQWITRVFDVITTPKEYHEIPAAVRKGLKPLLAAVSRRGGKGRIEIASDCLQRVFFWNIKAEPFDSIDFETYIAEKKPLLLSPVPPNSFELAEILISSRQFRNTAPVKTWIDLYRRYAVIPAYGQSKRWLKTVSLKVESVTQEPSKQMEESLSLRPEVPRLKTTGLPLDFHKIIGRCKNVLLTGPAGSGKTTTFRLFETLWMSQEDTPSGEKQLCFYVRLRNSSHFLGQSIETIDMADLIGRSVVSTLRGRCSEEELRNCETIQNLTRRRGLAAKPPTSSYNDLLECVREEVAEWFRYQGRHQSNVVVLIDGINELTLTLREKLTIKVEELIKSQCQCHLAVSCRSNFVSTIFLDSHRHITRFELQELDTQQIIEYLEYNIPDKGRQIFESRIHGDHRLLSLTKNPFCLTLIVQKLTKNPTGKIPTTRATLIEDFIISAIRRKHSERIYDPEYAVHQIKDDMLYVVLPKVAKWSLDVLTAEEDDASGSFIDSKDFQNPSDSDSIFETLAIAERYGLLSFSGLMEEFSEHREYPVFSHDNFRDYFAARYLKRLDRADLLRQLPALIEYLVWDEPLVLFQELDESKVLCQSIAELVLSKDAILAGKCVRHARVINEELCLRVASQVAKLPRSFEETDFLNNMGIADERSHVESLASYALGRLSVVQLTSAIQNRMYPDIETHLYLAIQENVTPADLDFLKGIAQKLSKTPNIKLACILTGIATIPTYEAFDFVVNTSKDAREILDRIPGISDFRDHPDAFFLKVFLRLAVLDSLSYVPSLATLIERFPPDKSREELAVLLPKFAKVDTNELPVLEKFVFSEENIVSLKASQLLAKILGKEAVPLLLERFNRLELTKNNARGFLYSTENLQRNQLEQALLEMFAALMPPNQVTEILVSQLQAFKKKASHTFQESQTVPDNLLKLLAQTCTADALKYIVSRACQDYNSSLAIFCVDLLKNWPDQNAVLSSIKELKSPVLNRPTMLVSGILRPEEFASEVESIFGELFSIVLEGHKLSPPKDEFLLQVYEGDWDRWHEKNFEEALSVLPLAIRAVENTQSIEIMQKVLQIVEWQYRILASENFERGFRTGDESFESFDESLNAFIFFVSRHKYNEVVETFLKSDVLKNLLNFVTRKQKLSLSWEYRHTITISLQRLSETISVEYVSRLFLMASQQYKENIGKVSSDEDISLTEISKVLAILCKRLDDKTTVDFLRYLKSRLRELPQEYSDSLSPLITAIKLLKGRRYLSVFCEPASKE